MCDISTSPGYEAYAAELSAIVGHPVVVVEHDTGDRMISIDDGHPHGRCRFMLFDGRATPPAPAVADEYRRFSGGA